MTMNSLMSFIIILIKILHITSLEFSFTVIDNFITSNICIGTPKQCFCVLMDTGSPFTWVPHVLNDKKEKLTFDESKSKTYKQHESSVQYHRNKKTVKGRESSDYVTIHFNENEISEEMKWALVTGTTASQTEFDGIFGLIKDQSFFIRNNTAIPYNYIEALHRKQHIKHKTISFKFISGTKGLITIGEQFIKSKATTCASSGMEDENLKRFGAYWYCEVTRVMYGKSMDEIVMNGRQFALIVTGERKIFAPMKEAMEIYSKYETMSHGRCIINTEGEVSYLTCYSQKDVDLLEKIEISFGKVNIVLDPHDLFEKRDNDYVYVLKSIPHESIWVIGEPVLRNYQTVFDYDSALINFIDKNHIGKAMNMEGDGIVNGKFKTMKMVVLIMFCIIMISGICLWFIRKFALKRLYDKHMQNNFIDFNGEDTANTQLGLNKP